MKIKETVDPFEKKKVYKSRPFDWFTAANIRSQPVHNCVPKHRMYR